ncbi:murein L,D-transpeptidase catalytic domain family protein [Algoriphagus hitonicola]|uniref:L,D-transpeptidase catalytic domain n=1 Tax=Algoriphagus hitonicola TaxID=435880 RepID=A0A1I2PDF7_9BACT|nr:murein L,D-transpeptidase catalytic domain family protein [Algoriphagus hitonicola]SFG11481.1 L,D-transpeptidase catalytic domain [Algoriphagus hitonicola]
MPIIHLISLILLLTLSNTPSKSSSNTEEIHSETSIKKDASLYERLKSHYPDVPNSAILEMAIKGYQKLHQELENPNLVIIDFSLPSTAKRLWVINPIEGEVLLHSVVSHGRNSGQLMATQFSNRPESYQSSLGFYKTAETYHGKHGYSLRLDGLEKGVNDQARNRAIVIHGADYATEEFAKATGRLGRSLGCPALPSELSAEVIDLIKDGSLLLIYGNDQSYLQNPPLLQP